ncbi:MAG: UDP-N-acetylmuramate--L-alanine ligase [Planctomycetes bacterium]|nr:UDP-N-acetylmuramate--L-alanine ligase [Planctomycetota bacterium]
MRAGGGERRHFHLVGIGGSGLASLAAHLLLRGDRVSGCDQKDGSLLRLLARHGARIDLAHAAGHVTDSLDALVYTAAAKGDHPELQAAAARSLPAMKYAQFLGELTRESECVAVAGTHGKTTTTTLLTEMLAAAGLDPSAVVGGFPVSWPLPGRAGAGPHFVVEACEYDRSFLNFDPRLALVTNVEPDHLDFFGTHDKVVDAFADFLAPRVAGRVAVLHESAAAALHGRVAGDVQVVGESAACSARLVRAENRHGCGRGTLRVHGHAPLALELPIAGDHNLVDAALAATAALELGAAPLAIEQAVRAFRGVRRRLEPVGARDGVQFFSDYAHHPTEIRAVRQALRDSHPGERLVVVFQPHQASRTRDFRDDFALELAAFDEVVVPNIFSVRESREGVLRETEALVSAIAARGRAPHRAEGLGDVFATVGRVAQQGDVVVLMGAGDIDDLAEELREAPARAREATVA